MKLKLIIRYWVNKLTTPFKTDQIDFRVSTEIDEDEVPWYHTDIIINNKSIFKRLEEYELIEANRTKTNRDLAGKYIGIGPHDLFRSTMKIRSGKYSAWQCSECQSYCSAHLYCNIRVGLFFIYWNDFTQVAKSIPFNSTDSIHEVMREKTKWNYEAFGPFKFKKSDFYNKIKLLHTQTEKFI